MPVLRYTLYHVTNRPAADAILANGFRLGKKIQLANAPWKIGTKGDTAIKVVIDLEYDEELCSGKPGDTHQYQRHIEPQQLNDEAELSIIDTAECERLREEFGILGDATDE